MTAYNGVLDLHNVVRWLVFLAGLMAASRALYGWIARRPWTSTDNLLGLLFTIAVDVQVLLGLLLYFFLSPITRDALSNFGAAMANSSARFWSVEHVSAMIAVLVLVHLGRILSKRATDDVGRNKRAAIFYTLAVLVVILGNPWFRPLLPGF